MRIQRLDFRLEFRDLRRYSRVRVFIIEFPELHLKLFDPDIDCFLFCSFNLLELLVDVLLLDLNSGPVAFVHDGWMERDRRVGMERILEVR